MRCKDRDDVSSVTPAERGTDLDRRRRTVECVVFVAYASSTRCLHTNLQLYHHGPRTWFLFFCYSFDWLKRR